MSIMAKILMKMTISMKVISNESMKISGVKMAKNINNGCMKRNESSARMKWLKARKKRQNMKYEISAIENEMAGMAK
jgi:hypothetical protein